MIPTASALDKAPPVGVHAMADAELIAEAKVCSL